jgi:FAD binding domain
LAQQSNLITYDNETLMADQGWKIAIVGGGVGGLTLGLALREQGIEVDIYEQADELREVGAAVALSANATRFYERIGLADKFSGLAFEIDTLIYRDGRSGKVIGKHRGKPSYREQFGAPYWGVHRADLQKILSGTLGMERIHLNKRLVDLTESADEVTLRFTDGSTAKSSAATALGRPCGNGCWGMTTSCTRAARRFAASSRPRFSTSCRIPRRSSSGWGRAAICCTIPSATAIRTSSRSSETPRRGRRANGRCPPTKEIKWRASRIGIQPSRR